MYIYTLPHGSIITGSYTARFNMPQLRDACKAGTSYTPETFQRQHQLCRYTHLIICEQLHGTTGITVTQHDDPYQYQPYHHTGDYIVTTQPGIACGIATADCAPIVIYDPETPSIASIHAGWRGLAYGVIDNALKAMYQIATPSYHTLHAYIGPCAGSCCYRVGTSVVHEIAQRTPGSTWYHNHDDAHYIDLATCAMLQLTARGILHHQIWGPYICTICHPHMCSYRAHQTPYRHMTYAVIHD